MEEREYVFVRVLGVPDKILVSLPENEPSLYGKEVLIETEHGQYLGFVNSFSFKDGELGNKGRILREVTLEDRERAKIIEKKKIELREEIRHEIQELGLAMKVTHVQFTLDERTATIFFIAPHRIDFRDLLKVLRSRYSFKCVLRQISEEERDDCYHLDHRII
jgi:cell fate regulator YaaT (PSP1 superfamily)